MSAVCFDSNRLTKGKEHENDIKKVKKSVLFEKIRKKSNTKINQKGLSIML